MEKIADHYTVNSDISNIFNSKLIDILINSEKDPDPRDTLISDDWYGILVKMDTYKWKQFQSYILNCDELLLQTDNLFIDYTSIPDKDTYLELVNHPLLKDINIQVVRILNGMGEYNRVIY